MATYYINALTFSAATSVFMDVGLSTIAPDGFYSFTDIYREQTSGILGAIASCINHPMIANDDTYSAFVTVGFNGGNILSNDTVGGSAATTSNVVITQLTTSNSGVTITTGGTVVVDAATPVGNYNITYKICEIGNISNCDTANIGVTINVLPNSYSFNNGSTCSAACNGTFASVEYSVKSGLPSCVDGALTLTAFTNETIYSSDIPLNIDSLLYADSGLTTPISFDFIQIPTQDNVYAVIALGKVFRILTFDNTPCFK